jgi:L-ascorbate metabolism protein UlaG (beta-lactamase superfamily)
MKIKWLGHACFLITSAQGIKIITDPYTVNASVKYAPINETADIVTVSHDHHDHNAVSSVQGNPQVVKGAGVQTVKGIEFRGIATYHDNSAGEKRGLNTVTCFTVDKVRICHMGDLGHVPDSSHLKEMGEVDILFIPVGGFYTIDAQATTRICDTVKPRITVPMHYKTSHLDFPIVGVDDFLKGKQNVRMLDTCEIEYRDGVLPGKPEIIVFKPAA